MFSKVKGDNPPHDVRVTRSSILYIDGVLQVDDLRRWHRSEAASIEIHPGKPVLKLGLEPGADIRLNEYAFVRLSGASFEEIQKKYL